MSRPSRSAVPGTHRERLRLDFTRAATLRQSFPQLAEVRVEFEFQDGTALSPSPQSYSYFPAARSFFRYACPCHACSGEFDLTAQVAELARQRGNSARRTRSMNVSCSGQRSRAFEHSEACPVGARVRVSAVLRDAQEER